MKNILFFLLLLNSLIANDKQQHYAPSTDCKSCHTQIYNEFEGSMHQHSTPQRDPIHNAVWSKHPQNIKAQRYGCGKCHTPAANNLNDMKTKGKKALPMMNNETHQAGISCAYCHRIKDIELHKKSNVNIMTTTEKEYFGTLKDHIKSPYHGIITKGNQHMQNGNVCIGCHSHKQNKHGLNVCSTNIDNEMNGLNCVSCHMPKIKGSVSSLHKTATHTFHGFAGSHSNSEMLAKYVNISVDKKADSFTININNKSSHALLLHPLRTAVLKVDVTHGKYIQKFKDKVFVRVIGKDAKPAMPWAATTTLKDTMIHGNENRQIRYNYSLKKGDTLNITLGWYLVNPKALKKLGLEKETVASQFIKFKKEHISF